MFFWCSSLCCNEYMLLYPYRNYFEFEKKFSDLSRMLKLTANLKFLFVSEKQNLYDLKSAIFPSFFVVPYVLSLLFNFSCTGRWSLREKWFPKRYFLSIFGAKHKQTSSTVYNSSKNGQTECFERNVGFLLKITICRTIQANIQRPSGFVNDNLLSLFGAKRNHTSAT